MAHDPDSLAGFPRLRKLIAQPGDFRIGRGGSSWPAQGPYFFDKNRSSRTMRRVFFIGGAMVTL